MQSLERGRARGNVGAKKNNMWDKGTGLTLSPIGAIRENSFWKIGGQSYTTHIEKCGRLSVWHGGCGLNTSGLSIIPLRQKTGRRRYSGMSKTGRGSKQSSRGPRQSV